MSTWAIYHDAERAQQWENARPTLQLSFFGNLFSYELCDKTTPLGQQERNTLNQQLHDMLARAYAQLPFAPVRIACEELLARRGISFTSRVSAQRFSYTWRQRLTATLTKQKPPAPLVLALLQSLNTTERAQWYAEHVTASGQHQLSQFILYACEQAELACFAHFEDTAQGPTQEHCEILIRYIYQQIVHPAEALDIDTLTDAFGEWRQLLEASLDRQLGRHECLSGYPFDDIINRYSRTT